MEFAGFMGLTVIVAVSFFSIHKRLHVYESVFCYLLFVGVLVTLVDVMTPMNSRFLQIAKEEIKHYWTLRLIEILLLPFLMLLYLEGMNRLRGVVKKGLVTLLGVAVGVGVETAAVWLQAIGYDRWQPWWSWPAWLVALLLIYGMQQGFRRLLRREGVVI